MRLAFSAFVCVLVAFAAHGEARGRGDVIAVVLGQEITVEDADRSPITGLVGDPLIEKFIEDNNIQPTEDELAESSQRLLELQRRGLSMLEDERTKLEQNLKVAANAKEREEVQNFLDVVVAAIDATTSEVQGHIDMRTVRRMAMHWKTLRVLDEKYRGLAHYQQVGAEPFDAVRDFLEEQEAIGAFTILDQNYREEFWHYVRTGQRYRFFEGQQPDLISELRWVTEEVIDE